MFKFSGSKLVRSVAALSMAFSLLIPAQSKSCSAFMGTTDRVRVNTDTENTAIERTARIFLERDQAKSAGRGFMTAGEVFMSMAVLINIVTKNAQGISRYLARNGEVGRAANTLFTAIHPGDALIVSWSMALAGLSLFFSGKLYNLFRVNQFKSDMAKKAGSF